jgi:hypothetical protein
MAPSGEAAAYSLPEIPPWRITYAEIAGLARVQRPVPTTWSRRHPDFPAPVASEDGRPLFDAHEVVAWLTATGRGNADPRRLQAELALHVLSALRTPAVSAPLLVGALTALVCLRQQLDAPLAELRWTPLLEQAADLDPDDAFLVSELRALPDAERVGPSLTALADELTEAAYTPAEAFDWVMESRRRLGSHDLAAAEPAASVVRALAALSGIDALADGSVVATPHARSGDLLAALHTRAAEDAGHTYLAADTDPGLIRLVRRRMLVRGVNEYDLGTAEGDDLPVDEWGYPDLLACVLPYEAGETRSAQAVLEQVQALTDYLADGSTAVVLGPADVLVRPLPRYGEADRLRRSFLGDGLLKAAIGLPDGAFPYRPGYRTAVWVLARTRQEDRAGRVLLADYSARPLTDPVLEALADDIALWRASGWRGDHRHEPAHAAVVPVRDLAERPGAALTPQHRPPAARYTRSVKERPVLISDLERRLAELNEQAPQHADLRAVLRTQVVLRPDDLPVRRTTVARLLAERRLRRRSGHRIADEHLTADGHYTVLTPDEVLGTARPGSHRIDRGVFLTGYEHAQFTQPGDVVVTTSPSFGAYVDAAGLSLVAAPARILRVHPDADPPVLPRVLAALLRAAAAEHTRTSGAVRASRAVEDLPIPDLGREEARRFDAMLAEIDARAALLREQSAALDDLVRITAAGLADGTLTLHDLPATHH